MRTKTTLRLKSAILLLTSLFAPPLSADTYTDSETGITYPGTYNEALDEFILDPECTELTQKTLPNVKRIVIPGKNLKKPYSSSIWFGHNKLEELIFLDECVDMCDACEFKSCTNLRKIRFGKNFTVKVVENGMTNLAKSICRSITYSRKNVSNVSFLPHIEEISISADITQNLTDVVVNYANYGYGSSDDGIYYYFYQCNDDPRIRPKVIIRDGSIDLSLLSSYQGGSPSSVLDIAVEVEQPVDASVCNIKLVRISKIAIIGYIKSAIFRKCYGLENLSLQHLSGCLGNLFIPEHPYKDNDVPDYLQTLMQYKEDGAVQKSYIPKDLATLAFTDGCEEIPYGALSNCTMLERLTIASSVFKVGEKALYGCARLKDIYLKGAEPPVAFDNSFEGMRMSSCRLHVPAGCVEAYRNAPGWRLFSLIEDDGADAVISVSKTVENGGVIYGLNSYDYGDVCELTAVANSGYTFAGWYDNLGNLITNGATLQQEVKASATYVADFRADIGTGNSEATPGDGSAVISWPAVSGASGYDIKIYASNDSENAIQTIHIDADGNQSRANESSDLFKVTIKNLTTAGYIYRINILNTDGITTDQICGAFAIEKSELFEMESDAVSVEILRGEGIKICGTTDATLVRIASIGGSIMYNRARSGIYTIPLPRGIYIVQLPDKTLKVQI